MSNLEALELKDIARTDKDTGSAEAQIYFFTKKNHTSGGFIYYYVSKKLFSGIINYHVV